MLKGIKLRLYPNLIQQEQLYQMFGNARFVWNKTLDMMNKNVNQLAPQVWCITLLSEDDFGNTSISATCFNFLEDAKEVAENYLNICESQYVVSDYAAVGIRKSRLNVMTITPVSLAR